MNPMIIKMLISSIGIDNINATANSILNEAIKWADAQPLETGEITIVGLLYQNEGIPYYAAVTILENKQIGRYLVDQPVSELIKSLLSNLK